MRDASVYHVCVRQVTNRDLSVAVLRKFIPQLAQEAAEGKIKKPRQDAEPKKKDRKKGKKGDNAADADAAAEATADAAAQEQPKQVLFISRHCWRHRSRICDTLLC